MMFRKQNIKEKLLAVLFIINSIFYSSNCLFAQNHPNPPQRHTNNYPQSQNKHYHKTYPQNYPHTNPQPNPQPVPLPPQSPVPPVPPPPPPPIRQDFNSSNMYMNLGQLIKNS